jgi:hypothetical protein
MSNFIQTVADAREEKNMQDVIADHLAQKENKKNQELIDLFKLKIEEEKEAIIDCLDQNLFSFAQSSINRINEFQDEIHTLNSKMS